MTTPTLVIMRPSLGAREGVFVSGPCGGVLTAGPSDLRDRAGPAAGSSCQP